MEQTARFPDDRCPRAQRSPFNPARSARPGPTFDLDDDPAINDAHERPDQSAPAGCEDDAALDYAVGQYLADALTVWECYRDQQMAGAPLLLRFEDYDLVIAASENDDLAFWRGAVNTNKVDPPQIEGGVMPEGDTQSKRDDRYCMMWQIAPTLSRVIGQQVLAAFASDRKGAVIDFEEDRLLVSTAHGTVVTSLEKRPHY